jgi:tetratricopeptide (TPR) repeat protein
MKPNFFDIFKKLFLIFGLPVLVTIPGFSCDQLDETARKNWQKKQNRWTDADSKDVERWKKELAVSEAELVQLDKKIRELVSESAKSGSISWRIARAYMKASQFEMGLRYYQRAAEEASGTEAASGTGSGGSSIRFFDSALPYFDRSLVFRKIDKELLFEMGLAYANASKDLGWEPERRARAIQIFQGLIRIDPKDSRFPYQLALIYFDSSVSFGTWALQAGYRDSEKAFGLLDAILGVEPDNIPVLFAKANFNYRVGNVRQALSVYQSIRAKIESMDAKGQVQGGLKNNTSYQNVLKNIQQIEGELR